MKKSRRAFISALAGIAGFAGITSINLPNAYAGFRRRRHKTCCTLVPSTPTVPPAGGDPITEGFRDIPGTVMRIPQEPGTRLLAEIPPGEKRGYALHIGVNWTSPRFYGSTNNLDACVFDAEDMHEITTDYKFSSSLLTNEYATSKNVTDDIHRAANELKEGDLFVITYSGHGASQDDSSGDESLPDDPDVLDDPKGEPDGLDEAWCLHDRMLLDDELFSLWKRFKAGVRILVILDCCHSGTAVRSVEESLTRAVEYKNSSGERSMIALDGAASEIGAFLFAGDSARFRSATMSGVAFGAPAVATRQRQKVRTLPRAYNLRLMVEHRKYYQQLQRTIERDDRAAGRTKLEASVMLLAACQDSQLAREEGLNGLFTRAIKLTLNGYRPGLYSGNYEQFLTHLKTRIGAPAQVPNLYRIGQVNDVFFNDESPFMV